MRFSSIVTSVFASGLIIASCAGLVFNLLKKDQRVIEDKPDMSKVKSKEARKMRGLGVVNGKKEEDPKK